MNPIRGAGNGATPHPRRLVLLGAPQKVPRISVHLGRPTDVKLRARVPKTG